MGGRSGHHGHFLASSRDSQRGSPLGDTGRIREVAAAAVISTATASQCCPECTLKMNKRADEAMPGPGKDSLGRRGGRQDGDDGKRRDKLSNHSR